MIQTTLQLCRVKLRLCLKTWNLILLVLAMGIGISSAANNHNLQDSPLISMKLSNAPLEKAFALIKQQTPYRVIYDNSLLKKAKPVSLTVSNEPLLNVLSLLFRNQPFDYRVIEQSIIVTPHTTATGTALTVTREWSKPFSDTLITGMVMADSGLLPLSGATIQLKGTGIIVTTDNNGRFSMRIPEAGGILQVSYVGHNPKAIAVDSRTGFPITILLVKKPMDMDAVTMVSTGYESLPRERITGSFTQIDNKTINQQVGANIIDRLKGVANSVLFDRKTDGPSFTVRGLSTINGPKEPLIILDNYPYEGDINNINPNDVESITILKDAAAASIWGTRAGNGVVVITTKKGKYNQPTKLEFSSNMIITEKPDLFYLPQMTSADHIDVEEMLFNNGFYNSQINSPVPFALTPAVDIFLKKQRGSITSQEAASQLSALKSVDIRNEYNKHFYRQAFHQQHALNIRGGSDKIAYLVSGGYDKGLSNLDAPNNRITLRSENNYKPIKAAQLNFGLLYTNSSVERGKPGYGDILIGSRQVPYLSFSDENGNHLAVAKSWRKSFTDTAGGGKLLDWNYYPLEDYKYHTSKTNLTDLIGKLGLNYKLMPGLDLDIKYQYQKQQTTNTTLAALESYYARDLINKYTQLDYATGKVKYAIPLGGIFGKSVSTLESQNLRGQINFNRKTGNHELVSLLGSEIRQTRISTDHLSAFGYDPVILTTGVVDVVNPQLNFVTKSYDYLNGGGVSFTAKNNRFISFFANASYIFKGKYILTASARNDASNLFGKATNDKWTPLWSVGGGWNISDERFYTSGILPELKLRATYGYSGNVDQSKSAVTVMAYSGNATYTALTNATITQYKNSALRWERVGMINFGLEFSVKNKVITGSIDYYRKKGVDLFGPSPIDYTAGLGYFTIIKNVADMKASGWDLALMSKNLQYKNWSWTTNFLLSYNNAKTDKYYLAPGISSGSFINTGKSITPIPGQPLYNIISYKSAGLDNRGYPQGYLNNMPSTSYNLIANDTSFSNLIYSGSATPTYFGALMNNFSWNGFSFSMNMSYKLGYYFRRSYLSYGQLFDNGIGHAEFANRWKQPGDELITQVPSMIYPRDSRRDVFYGNSDVNVENGSHLRLQYVNIAYDFSRLIFKKKMFKEMQVYINMSNLGILWRANNRNIDPDFPTGIPSPKSYSLGLRTSL